MADGEGNAGNPEAAPTKADFCVLGGKIDAMEADLYQKLADLIRPLTEQITQLNLSVQATAKLAEGAMDMCIAQNEDIRALQTESETQAERLAIIANRQRFFNLKFRGLQEKTEHNSDLKACMETWLSERLNRGERGAPVITQAYRVGRGNVPERTQPRDVVVTFVDIDTKHQILDLAKEKGYLMFKEDRVLVFKDLAPEALAKKRELKEIVAILKDVNVRHRWASPLKLQFSFKGKSYFIRSEEEGLDILQSLGIATPMTTERASAKRKLVLQSPPTHASKKTHKTFGR